MSELKPRITENGIDYILVGDYYIPDLKLPEEHRPIGKYGRMHREYLREVHPARLNTLVLTGELWPLLFLFTILYHLFLIHHLENNKFQVIRFISCPQDRVISSLGAVFYLAQPFMYIGGCFTDGFGK